MEKILLTGATGQLGKELCKLLESENILYKGVGSSELDITDKEAVDLLFRQFKPSFIFHCAAYTNVDKAEDEDNELNWKVNSIGSKNIAEAAQNINATIVYVSTDYVFDGDSNLEYDEEDKVNPRNEYGKAKLSGENVIKDICSNYYIVRTSWVFGEFGRNFVYTMRRLAQEKEKLSIVSDQVGRPTWTKSLSEFLLHIYNVRPDYGIYNFSNENSCSWFEFASVIIENKNVKIQPVTSDQYPQKAYRPRHSVMNLDKAKSIGFNIITWQEALAEFISDLK